MGLKDFIDRHPLPVAIGLVVASIGVSSYYWKTVCENKAEATQTLFEGKLTKQETELSRTVAELRKRISSIDRQVSDSSSYFDITKISIPRNRVRELSDDYAAFRGGRFFVHEPRSPK